MRASFRSAARSLLVAAVAISGSAAVGVTATLTAEVVLNAKVTPLIVPGTGTPRPQDVSSYMPHAVSYYVDTSGACGVEGCDAPVPVPYIAQFWPFPFEGWGGLEGAKWNVSVASGVTGLTSELVGDNNPSAEHPVAVFGYSQGATVASIVKASLADLTAEQKEYLSFVLIGNPNRPNGGLFERLAILGTVPILDATFGQPTPTDIGIETHDVALEYDGVSDAPSWVLNPLAVLNALAGFEYVHGTYLAPDDDEPATATPYGYTPEQVQAAIENAEQNCTAATHCQQHGDTYYITLPAKTLPIMQPFLDLAASTGTEALVVPIVDLLSPMAQTLIETGYDRSDYGAPTPFRLLPKVNPVTLVSDLVNDIPEGITAALNPGLDPLPGWTDPTVPDTSEDAPATGPDSATTITVSRVEQAPQEATVERTVASRPDRTPITRLSAIARPGQGLVEAGTDPVATDNDRAAARKAPRSKDRPARHTAKSTAAKSTKGTRASRAG